VIGGHSLPVSVASKALRCQADNMTDLKVHHEGFFEDQAEALSADTGAPNIQEDIKMSDMIQNGVNGHTDATA
jgi:hypothetical protein